MLVFGGGGEKERGLCVYDSLIGSPSTPTQTHTGGIYDNPECTGRSLDHHLTIVGFTPDAWIAKAALGVAWGEGGYIRLARNKNMCGLAEWAVVPIVK